MSKKIKIILSVLSIYIIILLIFTLAFDVTPIIIKKSVFKEEAFYLSFITNMYNSVLDFIVFSIILWFFIERDNIKSSINKYHENIDDCRFWDGEEATYKIAGNIRRLLSCNQNKFELSNCMMNKIKLKEVNFIQSKFRASSINESNFTSSQFFSCDFQACEMNNARMNKVEMDTCNLKYVKANKASFESAKITNSQLTKADFTDVNFSNANLINCNFEKSDMTNCNLCRANLKGAKNLSVEQILSSSNIEYLILDNHYYSNTEIKRRTKKNPPGPNI